LSSDAHRISAVKAGRHCVGGLIAGVGGVAMVSRWRFRTLCPDMAFLAASPTLVVLGQAVSVQAVKAKPFELGA
jgi:hypothetical protein